jgi:AcrR family transcriptional regulator
MNTSVRSFAMARKSSRRSSSRPVSDRATASRPSGSNRDKAIAALLELLGEQSFESIGLAQIADSAGLSLADLRAEFGSPLSILAAHIKDVDRAVLASQDADMADESPRERLFDVLMRRLDILEPHKDAVRSLMKSVPCNPGLALALNALAVQSQQWMLTAAGIGASGPKGMLRAQGLAMMFANVLRTWVDDDDEGHARTLAALDRELARGQRFAGMLDDLCRIPERARDFVRRSRRQRRGRQPREAA